MNFDIGNSNESKSEESGPKLEQKLETPIPTWPLIRFAYKAQVVSKSLAFTKCQGKLLEKRANSQKKLRK